MLGVMLGSCRARDRAQFEGNEPEPLALDPADNLAHEPALHGIRLADH
jgi:hypothetical protein